MVNSCGMYIIERCYFNITHCIIFFNNTIKFIYKVKRIK